MSSLATVYVYEYWHLTSRTGHNGKLFLRSDGLVNYKSDTTNVYSGWHGEWDVIGPVHMNMIKVKFHYAGARAGWVRELEFEKIDTRTLIAVNDFPVVIKCIEQHQDDLGSFPLMIQHSVLVAPAQVPLPVAPVLPLSDIGMSALFPELTRPRLLLDF